MFRVKAMAEHKISTFTKPHRKKVKVIKSGDGIHHKVDSS